MLVSTNPEEWQSLFKSPCYSNRTFWANQTVPKIDDFKTLEVPNSLNMDEITQTAINKHLL